MGCTACSSLLRVLENVPVLGHLIAMCYGCANNKDKAERAALKATVGIACGLCNCSVEAADEMLRKRTDRLTCRNLTPRPDWMKQHKGNNLKKSCQIEDHTVFLS